MSAGSVELPKTDDSHCTNRVVIAIKVSEDEGSADERTGKEAFLSPTVSDSVILVKLKLTERVLRLVSVQTDSQVVPIGLHRKIEPEGFRDPLVTVSDVDFEDQDVESLSTGRVGMIN